MQSLQSKAGILLEFIRYCFVGGFSFLVDAGTLFLCNEYILPNIWGKLYFSTACGFLTGIAANYILSLLFVFDVGKKQKRGRNVKSFLIFVIVGLIGLALTEFGMYVGADILKLNYMIVKVIVAAIVLVWNYGGRKILIFR